jgi:PAS domain S-box-containing protein
MDQRPAGSEATAPARKTGRNTLAASGFGRSLWSRLILLVGLALAPVLAFQLYAEYQARGEREQEVRTEALRLLRVAASDQQRIIESAHEALTAVGTFAGEILSGQTAQEDHACSARLAAMRSRLGRYNAILLVAPDGRVICSADADDMGQELAGQKLFQAAIAGPGFVIGDHAINRHSGRPTLPVAQAWYTGTGTPAGVAILGIDLGWLGDQLEHLKLPALAGMVVADPAGTMLARRPGGSRQIGQPVPAWLRFIMQGSEPAAIPATSPDGKPCIVAFSPPGTDPHDLAVAIILDRQHAFATADLESERSITLILLGGALALAAAALAGGRLIRRPAARLLQAAHRWRDGDLSARAGVADDGSEFGQISAAFNEMAAALDAREQERLELLGTLDLAALMVRDWDGTIRFWSKGCERLYGWCPAEVIGRNARELLQTAFPVAAAEVHTCLLRDGVWRGDLQQRSATGAWITVSVHKVLRRDAAGQPAAVIENLVEVTALRRAERELRENETRLRLVQQAGRIADFEWPLDGGTAAVSAQFRRLHDLPETRGRMTLREWLELVDCSDRERIAARIHAAISGNKVLDLEYRLRTRGGGIRWIAVRAQVFGGAASHSGRMLGAAQDITEIVAAREALAARQQQLQDMVAAQSEELAGAEARFRAIFDAQFQFTGLLSPDGTVLEVNRTALEQSGLTRQQVVGRHFWDAGWWPRSEHEWMRRAVAMAARGEFIRREIGLRGADGRQIWVDFSLNPVRNPTTGTIELIIPEARDLTERRTLEARLAQAEKVQALGQLAGGIAHDFNNILQTVSGAATLIERNADDPDKTRRLVRTILDAAQRGTSITQRLLSFARRGELRAEPVRTAELMDSMREVLAHTLGSTVTVVTSVDPGVPPLLADRGQLETALVNLGTNARDAMPAGGTLTLAAAVDEVATGAVHPAGLQPGRYVRLAVTDTGTGMSAEVLARITEPFFTTKRKGEGTGLGLPMVKGFAEQSGGALLIDSIPGAGTTVRLWLRQAEDKAFVPAPTPSDDRSLPGGTARVLLVDDDDLVRETLAEQFEELGFGVLVASNGPEALALLQAGEAVDVLISDLSMPGMNGVDTIGKARELRPGLTCFLLTGYVGERAALAAEGTFTLVRKPVSARTLAAKVMGQLEGAPARG